MTHLELYQERRTAVKETGIVTYEEKDYCHNSYLENGPEHIGMRNVVCRGELGAVAFSCKFDDSKTLSAEDAYARICIFKPSTSEAHRIRSNVLLYVDAEIITIEPNAKTEYWWLIQGNLLAVYGSLHNIYLRHMELA